MATAAINHAGAASMLEASVWTKTGHSTIVSWTKTDH